MSKQQVACFAAAAAILWVCKVKADEKPVPRSPDPNALFGQLDANQDGQLTADEVPADRKGLLERLLRNNDKNDDGKLTAEEFAAGLKSRERPEPGNRLPRPESGNRPGNEGPPAPDRMFKRLDTNRDGKVTLEEVPEPRRERFQRLVARGDKNGNGALEEQEFFQAFSGKPAAAGKPGAGQRPKGRPQGRPQGRPNPKKSFQ